jgi:ribonuclease HII
MASALASPTSLLTAGIDEAGRGALAGHVVAAACILPKKKRFPVILADSKKMTPEERETSYAWLIAHCIYGIGMVEASEIDRIGILACTERAMQMAVAQVSAQHSFLYLLVDGRDKFWFDHPHSSIIRGDDSEKCISAASIIAKVTRDHSMIELHQKFPAYGFHEHKGYGTPEHYEAIQKHGMTTLHRRTFIHLDTKISAP